MGGYLKLYTSIIFLLLINRVMTQNSESQEISNENKNSSTNGSNTDENKDEFQDDRSSDVAKTKATTDVAGKWDANNAEAHNLNAFVASLVQFFSTIFLVSMLLLGLLLQGIPVAPYQQSLEGDFPAGSKIMEALPVAGVTIAGGATGGLTQIVMSAMDGRTCPPGMCKPYNSDHCCCLKVTENPQGFWSLLSCPTVQECPSTSKSIEDTFSKLLDWLAK